MISHRLRMSPWPWQSRMRIASGLALGLVLAVLPGCASTGVGRPLVVDIAAADGVNPGDDGASLSVVVRLYQLKELGRFERASLDQLWRADKATLGEDIVYVDEWTLPPGGKLHDERMIGTEAQFYGVAAFFRKPERDGWRYAFQKHELLGTTGHKLALTLKGSRIVPADEDVAYVLQGGTDQNRTLVGKTAKEAAGIAPAAGDATAPPLTMVQTKLSSAADTADALGKQATDTLAQAKQKTEPLLDALPQKKPGKGVDPGWIDKFFDKLKNSTKAVVNVFSLD